MVSESTSLWISSIPDFYFSVISSILSCLWFVFCLQQWIRPFLCTFWFANLSPAIWCFVFSIVAPKNRFYNRVVQLLISWLRIHLNSTKLKSLFLQRQVHFMFVSCRTSSWLGSLLRCHCSFFLDSYLLFMISMILHTNLLTHMIIASELQVLRHSGCLSNLKNILLCRGLGNQTILSHLSSRFLFHASAPGHSQSKQCSSGYSWMAHTSRLGGPGCSNSSWNDCHERCSWFRFEKLPAPMSWAAVSYIHQLRCKTEMSGVWHRQIPSSYHSDGPDRSQRHYYKFDLWLGSLSSHPDYFESSFTDTYRYSTLFGFQNCYFIPVPNSAQNFNPSSSNFLEMAGQCWTSYSQA